MLLSLKKLKVPVKQEVMQVPNSREYPSGHLVQFSAAVQTWEKSMELAIQSTIQRRIIEPVGPLHQRQEKWHWAQEPEVVTNWPRPHASSPAAGTARVPLGESARHGAAATAVLISVTEHGLHVIESCEVPTAIMRPGNNVHPTSVSCDAPVHNTTTGAKTASSGRTY